MMRTRGQYIAVFQKISSPAVLVVLVGCLLVIDQCCSGTIIVDAAIPTSRQHVAGFLVPVPGGKKKTITSTLKKDGSSQNRPAFFVTERRVSPQKRNALALAAEAESASIMGVKEKLVQVESSTDRGRSVQGGEGEYKSIEALLEELESYNQYTEPTRSAYTGGSWTVGYTTAPPPSNGQLGPFRGIAMQVIDMEDKTYKNVLLVPPNDWLKASLDATWEEWDGELVQDNGDQKWKAPTTTTAAQKGATEKDDTVQDYGATCWRVTFEKLTISIFGTPIFTKLFENGTQRIWRTTYLDENTRIVRAGRTGSSNDEIPFYMTRTKKSD